MVTSGGSLTELQKRVLDAVAGVEPPFVLSGGGALAGVYLGHRTTRDLDLFWRNQARLDDLPRAIETRLRANGLAVTTLQSTPAFVQLRVSDGASVVIIDLVAEPTASLETPHRYRISSAEILVDSPQAILTEKLCALLERAELRDLIDVEALVRAGHDANAAIADAPRRDSGFSPLTLAWVLREWNVKAIASSMNVDDAVAERLAAFRRELIERLTTLQ